MLLPGCPAYYSIPCPFELLTDWYKFRLGRRFLPLPPLPNMVTLHELLLIVSALYLITLHPMLIFHLRDRISRGKISLCHCLFLFIFLNCYIFLILIFSYLFQTTKVSKKQVKRENALKLEQELQKIQDVILLNSILNTLGMDHIRNDFLEGKNGAVVSQQIFPHSGFSTQVKFCLGANHSCMIIKLCKQFLHNWHNVHTIPALLANQANHSQTIIKLCKQFLHNRHNEHTIPALYQQIRQTIPARQVTIYQTIPAPLWEQQLSKHT